MENLDLVSLNVSISPSYCIRGIANEVNVLCKVKTGHKPEIEALKHTPLNLAIVLDRSGSMSGQKIENAKLAIEQVISSLYKDDVFHLVCFASDVEVVIEGASLAKDSLDDILTKVKGIKATTCTNLWGGTERGAELIKQYHAADGSAKDRLFLFSDGLVNEGEQNQQTILRKVSDLMERGTLVSAFGIGDDFDETLMRGIADKGLGAYFFIENAQMIPSFVQFALHSIQTMVGDQACLIARGQNGACVDKFYGDTFDLLHGAKLGDLRSDNVRTVMLKMTVNGTSVTASALGEEEVLLVEMTWRDGEAEHVLSKALKVCYTTDPIDVEKSRVPEITVQLALQRSVKINEKLAKISDDNKKAIELQEELIQVFESVVEIDNNNLDGANKIEKFLKSAKADLEKLKSKGISKATQKEAHHKGYMVRRG